MLLIRKNQAGRTKPEAYRRVRALTEIHIPFDEVRTESALWYLSGKRRNTYIAPKLHPSVEIVKAEKDGRHYISLINGSGYFGNSFFDPVPMYQTEIEAPGVRAAYCLNGGTVTVSDDRIILNKSDHFEMIIWED